MPSAKSDTQRKVTACITLIDGPDPKKIVAGAKLRFQGLHRQSLFALTLNITTVLGKKIAPTEDNLAILRELISGREEDGDIFFEGRLITYCISNANGTGALVQVAHPDLRGLWRKSHSTIAKLVPKGNGFIDFLE